MVKLLSKIGGVIRICPIPVITPDILRNCHIVLRTEN